MRAGVLHLVDTLDRGGAERVAVELVNHLPRERFRPFLGTTRREGPLAGLVRPDVGRLRLDRKRTLDLPALRKLAAFIRENGISIVHAHSSSLFTAVLGTPAEVRIVWHDHFGRHEEEERPDWLYRLAALRVSGVVAVDEALARWSRERLQLAAGRVWYLPNFVDGDVAAEPVDLPGEPGRRIVCVANLRAQKDHLTLVRGFARVSREEPGAHLLLAGSEVEPDTARRVREAITGNVTLLGRRDDVPALLRSCDVGVLSSSSEGFPLALLEYGHAGLPVVATRVGRCAEVLGGAGLLVPPRDPDALADALLRLLRDAALRSRLGRELQERVRSLYSPAAVMERLERVYDAVLRS